MCGGGHVMRFEKVLCRFAQIVLLETARQPTPDDQGLSIAETDQTPEHETKPVSYPDWRDRARRSSFLVYL